MSREHRQWRIFFSSNGSDHPSSSNLNGYVRRIISSLQLPLFYSAAPFSATSGSYHVPQVTHSSTDITHSRYLFYHPPLLSYVHLFSNLPFHSGPVCRLSYHPSLTVYSSTHSHAQVNFNGNQSAKRIKSIDNHSRTPSLEVTHALEAPSQLFAISQQRPVSHHQLVSLFNIWTDGCSRHLQLEQF